MKKINVLVLVLVVILSISVLSGCNSNSPASQSPAAPSASASSAASSQAPAAASETAASSDSVNPQDYDGLLAWYFPLPHPFGQSVKEGVDAYIQDTGIKVNAVVGTEFTMDNETQNVEAMVAQGYKYFSIFPGDAAGANGLYQEMVDKGCVVNNFGVSTNEPTPASFCVSTNIDQATRDSVKALIEMMGGKGNLIVVLEALSDPATQIRKAATEDVVKQYPDVKIIQEVSGMNTVQEATAKIGDALAANSGNVDGVICTGFTCSDALCALMAEYNKSNTKKIWTIGIDTDDIILKAIKEGNMDATCAQNPYAIGYVSCQVMKLEKDGYVPVPGQYAIDSGYVIVNKDNVESFNDDMKQKTQDIIAKLTTTYMQKK
jgi:ribose transport system substrate-binding protein